MKRLRSARDIETRHKEKGRREIRATEGGLMVGPNPYLRRVTREEGNCKKKKKTGRESEE